MEDHQFFTVGSNRSDVVATLPSNGKVLFTGSIAYSPRPTHRFTSTPLYDPATGAAEVAGAMTTSRFGHLATLFQNGQVLVADGEELASTGSALLSGAEIYTPWRGQA